MKKLIISLLLTSSLFTTLTYGSSREFLDLSIQIQALETAHKTISLKLPLNNEESTQKLDNRIYTMKAIKLKGNQYKVQLKVQDKNEILTDTIVLLEAKTETMVQTFDSEGNNDLKIIIKAIK